MTPGSDLTANLLQLGKHLSQHLVAECGVRVHLHHLRLGELAAKLGRPLEVNEGLLITLLQPVDEPPLAESLTGGVTLALAEVDGVVEVLERVCNGTWFRHSCRSLSPWQMVGGYLCTTRLNLGWS